MSLIRLTIDRISYSQNTNGAYALLLSEKDGERKLPVVIGAFEAQSIAVALEKEIKPPRPLTHDLFKNFSDCFEIKIKQVIIHKIIDGVFFSSLICVGDKIEEGDILAEIETDKATMEFESFHEGILLYIGLKEGESAKVDSLLAIIGEKGEDFSALLNSTSEEVEVDQSKDESNMDESLKVGAP